MPNIDDFSFILPQELIADKPVFPRDSSRLMVINPPAYENSEQKHFIDTKFPDIINFLRSGDVMVLNNTKVIPAFLRGFTASGKKISLNLLETADSSLLEVSEGKKSEYLQGSSFRADYLDLPATSYSLWKCMIKGKKIKIGEKFIFLPNSDKLSALDDKIKEHAVTNYDHEKLNKSGVNYLKSRFTEKSQINSTNSAVIKSQDHFYQEKDGEILPHLTATMVGKIEEDGVCLVLFNHSKEEMFSGILQNFGSMPLPPYMKRKGEQSDHISYQTVYAKKEGSVAAHTAGLHFTHEILNKIEKMGVKICYITLHIGAGTFMPIKTKDIADHKMHEELYSISAETAKEIKKAKEEGRRVIAVGTTSMRAIESAATHHWILEPANSIENVKVSGFDKIKKYAGDHDSYIYSNIRELKESRTGIFIKPGYNFKICDALITNFHMPASTLFILVCAFAGKEIMKQAYNLAIEKRYRFFSYGDASLIFLNKEIKFYFDYS